MSNLASIYRHIFAISFGVVISFFVAALISVLWTPLFWPTLLVLSACWTGVAISTIRKQRDGTNAAVLNSSRHWRATDLPAEFQFIEPNTTIGDITQKIGAYSKLRG